MSRDHTSFLVLEDAEGKICTYAFTDACPWQFLAILFTVLRQVRLFNFIFERRKKQLDGTNVWPDGLLLYVCFQG